ncbi:MAG TPA: DUF4282 domain-containing protein [Caulobacteraceae bacterium]|nr:DUF4282 domain-containing protein [Caulobacteraceae bacterium]
MGPARGVAPRVIRHGWLWNLLTFERMITGPVIHLVYWAGLGVIVIAAFGVVGASVAIAFRERSLETVLLAIPAIIGGLLIVSAGGLVWRAFCEFYVVIFRIGDDLTALRRVAEEEQAQHAPPTSFPPRS